MPPKEDKITINGTFGEDVLGVCDVNIKHVKDALDVNIAVRGEALTISGEPVNVRRAGRIINAVIARVRDGKEVTPSFLDAMIVDEEAEKGRLLTKVEIYPRTEGQRGYLQAMFTYDIVFVTGPAGTGKTYLAVACAVNALRQRLVKKIVLVRPAVEAGEKLGFLPGDLQDKVNPYLVPVYDALYDMLSYDTARSYIERGIIEVVPIAFMRGRTLHNAFIIMDEGQNTSAGQMLMFLTRMGMGSKVVVTGDVTQIDLPPDTPSGMLHALAVLRPVPAIGFVALQAEDIVRHPLVKEIVRVFRMDNGPQQ